MSRQVSPGQCPVHTVMTRDVVVARPDSGMRDVAELVNALRLRLLPVVDGTGRQVVGVVTVSDITRQRTTGGSSGWWPRKRTSVTAADVMTAPAVTVQIAAGVAAAARTMAARGVRAAPVVDERGQLRGIVTNGDLVRTLVRADGDIAAEVTGVLHRYVPSAATDISTAVDDGVVTLTGRPRARWMIPLALHLVRSVAGVVAVDDQLTDESPWWSASTQSSVGSVDSRTP